MVTTSNWQGWYNLEDLTDATGNGRTLTNVGSVTFSTPAKSYAAAVLGSTNSSKALKLSTTTPFGISLASFKSGPWSISLFWYCQRLGVDQWITKGQWSDGSRRANTGFLQVGVSNKIYFGVYDGTATNYDTGITVSTSTWYHLAASFDGSTFKVYVNGILTNSNSRTLSDASGSTGGFAIGSEFDGASYFCSGNIDLAGFRNATLSDGGVSVGVTAGGDVADLYNSGDGYALFEPLETSLVAYYKFDSDANDSVASYDGSVSGATSTTGKISNCYDFDGTNDYISVTSNPAPTGASSRSINFWFNGDAFDGNYVLLSYGAAGTNALFELRCYGGYSRLFFSTGTTAIGHSGTVLSTGTWYMGTITYDGTTARLYVNTTEVATLTVTLATGSSSLYFGSSKTPDQYFNGRLDEIGVWSKKLSTEEIAALYNNGMGFSYPFDGTKLIAKTSVIGISGGTTPSIDTTGATLLIAVVTTNGTANISDNKGNTWTGLTAQTNTTITSKIFYVNSDTPTVGSGHTFTTTSTASVLSILAFNNTVAIPFDVENGSAAASGSTIAPGSITPSQNDTIIVTGVSAGNTMTTVTIDNDLVITNQQPLTGGVCYGHGTAVKIKSSSGAISPTWTFQSGSTSNISSTIASFKIISSASADTTSMFLMF